MLLSPRQGAHIAHMLEELIPPEATFVLNVMMPDGTFETISSHPPRLVRALMEAMVAAWSPEQVDNVRG